MEERTEALAHALLVAATAPTEEQSDLAFKIVEQLAIGLSEHQVAQAMRHARQLVNE